MRHLAAFLLLVGPLAGAALAQGAPRSIGDCEKIKGDLAYNQCLAMFGPKANVKAASAESMPMPAPGAQAAAQTAEEPQVKTRRGRYGRYGRGGRTRAAFTVGQTSSRAYRRSRRR